MTMHKLLVPRRAGMHIVCPVAHCVATAETVRPTVHRTPRGRATHHRGRIDRKSVV